MFESREQFVASVHRFGNLSIIVFILYGLIIGNIYNYIGIIIGSILAFLIVRRYGESVLHKLVSENRIQKYNDKLKNGKVFERFFTTAVFTPFASDKVIYYLAGLSDTFIKKGITIILLENLFLFFCIV